MTRGTAAPPTSSPLRRLPRDITLTAGALILLALGLHEVPTQLSGFHGVESYWSAGTAMAYGGPLYEAVPGVDAVPIPPGLAAVLAPITLLPETLGYGLWAVIVWLSLLVATALVWRWVGRGWWLVGLIPYAYVLMRGAHAEGLAVALVVGAILALRSRRDALSGGLLAVAAHLAFYPVFLLPALWLLGHRKAFRAGVAWTGGLSVVPLLWLLPAWGWDAFVRLPQLYGAFLASLWSADPTAMSLPAMLGTWPALVLVTLVIAAGLRRASHGRPDSLALLYSGLVFTGPLLQGSQGCLVALPLAILARRDPKLAGGLAVGLGIMELVTPTASEWRVGSTVAFLFVWLLAYRSRPAAEETKAGAPDRTGRGVNPVLRVLRPLHSPSTYLLSLGFVATAIAKATILFDLEGVVWKALRLVQVLTLDALVFFGLAALLCLAEWRHRRFAYATVPVALLVSSFGVINALCLGITGEQLTSEAVTLGFRRFSDLSPVLGDAVSHLPLLGTAGILVLMWGVPGGALYLLWRHLGSQVPTADHLLRIRWAGGLAVAAALLWVTLPGPGSLALQRLAASGVTQTAGGWLAGEARVRTLATGTEPFSGYRPRDLVMDSTIEALAEPGAPNLLVFVQESLRWDHTSLAGEASRASTPHLAALADRGTEVRTTRAVVPHTSKSLFSTLCARYPIMQQEIVEVSSAVDAQCLAEILGRAGYRTGFFQSAIGTFEDRPRLVAKMGFEHFEAWEQIEGERLTYLASDDESLTGPVLRWLEADGGERPFFAVVLTSAAHHPYFLSSAVTARATESGAPAGSEAERYARLTEGADRVLGSILGALKTRGLDDETIVVALGDHGEGFGENGVRQHDNNYYEEGLRVPLVFAGPGVPRGVIEGNASLVDVTPSILDLLDASLSAEAGSAIPGVSVWDGLPRRPRYFSCWYDNRCHGFVHRDVKVVYLPERRIPFWFDLAPTAVSFDLSTDPDERSPRPLEDEWAPHLAELHRVIESRRNPEMEMELREVRQFPGWECEAGRVCRYEGTPPSVTGPR